MKTNFILIVLVTLTAGDGCKKNKVENKPMKGEKVIMTNLAGSRVISANSFNPASFNNNRIRGISFK